LFFSDVVLFPGDLDFIQYPAKDETDETVTMRPVNSPKASENMPKSQGITEITCIFAPGKEQLK
jgi:hypothetical protein